MADAATELGKIIGGLARGQSQIRENMSSDDTDAQLNTYFNDGITLLGYLTLTKWVYPTDSFIVDHPVYGEVDSAVLKIDGGYDTTSVDNGSTLFTSY